MKKMRKTAFFILCIVMLFGVTQNCQAADDTKEKIKEGVCIDDVDVSGMTYDEAMDVITPVAAEKLKQKATLKVGSREIKVSLKKLGYQWKEDVVEEALGADRKSVV